MTNILAKFFNRVLLSFFGIGYIFIGGMFVVMLIPGSDERARALLGLGSLTFTDIGYVLLLLWVFGLGGLGLIMTGLLCLGMSLPKCVQPFARKVKCKVCGEGVKTCYMLSGDPCPAHPDGLVFGDGSAVCSEKCWEKNVGTF